MTALKKTSGTPVHLITLALFVFAGLWLVATVSFAAFLAPTAPERALQLDPSNPTALLALARLKAEGVSSKTPANPPTVPPPALEPDSVESPASEGVETSRMDALRDLALEAAKAARAGQPLPGLDVAQRDAVERLALKALQADPLNARALRLLGDVAEARGETERAEAHMRAAVRHSLRETTALAWLLDKAIERQDYDTAVAFADTLLRTRPQTSRAVHERLARLADSKAGNASLKALLATNPPWRSSFFATLPSVSTDARAPLDLMLSLKDTATPPAPLDVKRYLDFLVARSNFDLAYPAWLGFLDDADLAEAGFVFNGGFEKPVSGMPFDWRLMPGAGVTASVSPLTEQGGTHGLSIVFGQGRVDFKPVSQVTMLPPGDYQFSARMKGQMSGRRGLIWRIACAAKPRVPVAQGPDAIGKTPDWKAIGFTFSIPPEGCGAQFLQLELDARSASEQLVSGSLWYDDVTITRRSTADSTPPG